MEILGDIEIEGWGRWGFRWSDSPGSTFLMTFFYDFSLTFLDSKLKGGAGGDSGGQTHLGDVGSFFITFFMTFPSLFWTQN